MATDWRSHDLSLDSETFLLRQWMYILWYKNKLVNLSESSAERKEGRMDGLIDSKDGNNKQFLA